MNAAQHHTLLEKEMTNFETFLQMNGLPSLLDDLSKKLQIPKQDLTDMLLRVAQQTNRSFCEVMLRAYDLEKGKVQ